MRRWVFVTAMVAVLALSASTSYAETTYTGKYTTHGAFAHSAIGRVCAPSPGPCITGGKHRATGDPDVGNIGGTAFPFFEGTPTRADVADVTGLPISVTIAQSTDGDNTYGEEGEPRIIGCGTSFDLTSPEVPFEPDFQIIVFVYQYRDTTPCEGTATHGTVTLTTA